MGWRNDPGQGLAMGWRWAGDGLAMGWRWAGAMTQARGWRWAGAMTQARGWRWAGDGLAQWSKRHNRIK